MQSFLFIRFISFFVGIFFCHHISYSLVTVAIECLANGYGLNLGKPDEIKAFEVATPLLVGYLIFVVALLVLLSKMNVFFPHAISTPCTSVAPFNDLRVT